MSTNFIPYMPYSNQMGYKQPRHDQVLLNGQQALMDEASFGQLMLGQINNPPTGEPRLVGRMWKCEAFGKESGWDLCWIDSGYLITRSLIQVIPSAWLKQLVIDAMKAELIATLRAPDLNDSRVTQLKRSIEIWVRKAWNQR